MHHILKPKLTLLWEEGYSRGRLLRDLMAGLVVAIMALPLSIAFGVASGARPEQGLLTAIIAGFLGASLSGCHVQITGPAGAFIVLVSSTISQYGYEGLLIATLMAGLILLILGLFKVASNIGAIPTPVIVGFTAGLALVVATTQIQDFAGLQISSLPPEVFGRWVAYFSVLHTINPVAVALALSSLLITLLWPSEKTHIPGALIVVLLTSTVVAAWHLPVETLGDRFGTLSASFPIPRFPAITWAKIKLLFGPAVAIALLAGIESLLSAVVADRLTQKRHRPNMELISQGICNLGSALFGGIPATGAIARTAANVRAGGHTPVAGMFHAIVLLALFLFFTDTIAQIPLAALSGILLVVAYRMAEWNHFGTLLRSRRDVFCLVITFLLTLFVGIVVGILVGGALAFAQKQLTKFLARQEKIGSNQRTESRTA